MEDISKKCTYCGELKPLSTSYYSHKTNRDKKQGHCKKCQISRVRLNRKISKHNPKIPLNCEICQESSNGRKGFTIAEDKYPLCYLHTIIYEELKENKTFLKTYQTLLEE